MRAYTDPNWRWFWDHAIRVLPLWEGGGDIHDLVHKDTAPLVSGVTWGQGPWGPCLVSDGTASQTIGIANQLPSNGPFSVIYVGSMTQFGSSTTLVSAQGWRCEWETWSGTENLGFAASGGYGDRPSNLPTPVDNAPHVLGWSVDSNDSVKVYLDGLEDDIGDFGTIGAAGGPLRIFGGVASPRAGYCAAVYILNDVMDRDMQEALAIDPFGPLRYHEPGPYQYFPQGSLVENVRKVPARPPQWNVDPALTAPEWLWFWEHAYLVDPLFEVDGPVLGKYQGKGVAAGTWTVPQEGPIGKYFAGTVGGIDYGFDAQDVTGVTGYPFTIFSYAKWGGVGGDRIFDWAYSGDVATNYTLEFDSATGQGRMRARNNSAYVPLSAGPNLDDGKFHLIAAVHRSATLRELWVDGMLVGTTTSTVSFTNQPDRAAVGRQVDSTPSGYFDPNVAIAGILDFGPDSRQMLSWAEDPFGPIRHYRDTSPGPYQYFDQGPAPRQITTHKAKPPQWAWDAAFIAPEYRDLAKGLVSLVPAWEAGGDPYDYIQKTSPEMQGSYTWSTTRDGPALNVDGVSGSRIFYSDSAWLPTEAVTVLVICGPTTNNSFDRTFANINNSGAQFIQAIIQNTAADFQDYRWTFGSAGSLEVPNGTVTFGEDDVHVFRAGSRGAAIFLNGQLVGSSSTPRSRSADFTGFSWGGWRTTDVGQTDRDHSMFIMWDRELDDDEIRRISANPFGLVEHHRSIYRAQILLAIIGYSKLGGNPYTLLNALKGAEGSAEAQGVIDTLASGAKEGIGIVESLESSVTSEVGSKGALSQALSKASEIATQTGSKGAEGNTVTTESSVTTEVGFKDGTGQVFTSSEELMSSTSTKAGIGEAQLHELAYLITEARKEGYGEALAYDDGVLVVAAAKGADGNAFGKSNNLILSSTLKGGLGLSTATETGYGISDGTKAGTGRAQNNAFGALFALSSKATSGNTLLRQSSYFNLLGEKAGLGRTFGHAFGWATEEGIKSITTLGFALLSGHAYAGTSGEKEALGQGATVPHAYLEAVGEKEALGRTTAVAHAYLEALGEKEVSGTALGYEFGYETAEGEKNITVLGYVFGQGFGYGVTSGEKEALGYADLISQGQLESLGLKATEASAILSEFAVTESQGSKSSFGEALGKDSESAVIIGLKSIGSDVTVTGHGSVSSNLIKEMSSSTFVNAFGTGSESGQKEGSGAATTLGTPVLVALGIKDGVGVTQIVASGTLEGLGLKGMSADLIIVGHGWLNSLQTVSLDREIIDILVYINTGVSLDAQVVLNRDMSMYVDRQLDSNIYIVRTKNIDVEA